MKNMKLLLTLGVVLLLRPALSVAAPGHDDELAEDNADEESEEPKSVLEQDSVDSKDDGSTGAKKRVESPPDESTFSGANSVMKTKYGLLDGKGVEKSYNAWREVVIRAFLFVGQGKFGHGAGIFTALLVQIFQGKKKSLWEQLESKIETMLRKEFTKDKMDGLKDDFRLMNLKASKNNLFTLDDLDYVVSRLPAIFPQDHSTTTFTGSYAAIIKAYMFYLSAGYFNIMAQKKLDKCAFARELKKMRPDMVNAAEKLYKLRYQELEGVKYWNGQTSESGKTFVRFVDKITNHQYNTWIINTKSSCFGAIKSDTLKVVKLFIDDYNKFLDNKMHDDSCEDVLPDVIADDEIAFDYPSACYGSRDGGGECALPCEYFDSGSKWCFDYRVFKKLDDTYKELREGYGYIGTSKKRGLHYSGQWDWCTKPSFDICMPVEETKMSNLAVERSMASSQPSTPQ